MTAWNAAMLVLALVATGVALRLHSTGDPVWKLVCSAAVSSLAVGGSGLLPPAIAASLMLVAAMVAFGLTWSFSRDRLRELE